MGKVIPVLFGTRDDPDGTVTCACGEIFTGKNFQERWLQYLEHSETCVVRSR